MITGINYGMREYWNQMQEVEYCAGKIGKEEYQRILWHDLDLQPEGAGLCWSWWGPGIHIVDDQVGDPVVRC